jgi:DNA polymerase I-like protein with 3'-5' exonuclease and polymerase domains
MIDALKNGQDIHATTASAYLCLWKKKLDRDMRRKAKEVNFD